MEPAWNYGRAYGLCAIASLHGVTALLPSSINATSHRGYGTTLDGMLAQGKRGAFDMAFIDADKENLLAY
jgi:hypothetical protein